MVRLSQSRERCVRYSQVGSLMAYPAAMEKLVDELQQLPGVGPKTAERLAYYMIRSGSKALPLATAIERAIQEVRPCSQCSHLSDQDPCEICQDPERDRTRLLIVEQPKDLEAMERAGWTGLYHVLLGSLTQQDGMHVGPNEAMTLDRLGDRLKDVKEVVLGTNPDLEGDGTALVITEYLQKKFPGALQVTRLARGVPTGSALEYANPAVLAEAIHERRSWQAEAGS